MRLDKYLCECGLGTRSQVKVLLKQGKISVNGTLEKDGKVQVDEIADEIKCNQEVLKYQEFYYYVFHKPGDCVCANQDNLHKTVFSYVPMNPKNDLFTVGRLDLDTEGLLLITNDGEFSHRLLSPKKHVDKTYFAIWDKPATTEDITLFEKGLDIGDEKMTLPGELRIDFDNPKQVCITISEGRFHQVKRMSQAVGKEVQYLKRLSMGKFSLDEDLALGEYREFSKEELEYVRQYKSGAI